MNAVIESKKLAHQKNEIKYTLKAKTLVEVLENRTKDKPEFLIFMDLKNKESRVSSVDILEHATAAAQYLLAKGLKKNDKIVGMLPNGANFAYVYFGILMEGGVPIPVS